MEIYRWQILLIMTYYLDNYPDKDIKSRKDVRLDYIQS